MPMEHNLKSFMDASLGKEFSGLDMSKVGLRPNIYMPQLTEEINMFLCLSCSKRLF